MVDEGNVEVAGPELRPRVLDVRYMDQFTREGVGTAKKRFNQKGFGI